MTGTPAGWYDDPDEPGQQQRWYDGSAWTEHRAPVGATPPPPADAPATPTPPSAPTPPPGSTPPRDAPRGDAPRGGGPAASRRPGRTDHAAADEPTAGHACAHRSAADRSPTGRARRRGGAAPSAGPRSTHRTPPYVGGDPAPAKGSRTGLWIALAVVGVVVVVLGVAAVIALVAFAGGDDATEALEKKLPAEVQSAFAAQGLEVTVSKADCDDIGGDEGPFTTTCALTVDGLRSTIDVDVAGTVDGDTVNFATTGTGPSLLDEALAVKQSQPVVDFESDNTVTVTSCSLSEAIVVVEEGLTFTCDTDTSETVTFEVRGGALVITDVS